MTVALPRSPIPLYHKLYVVLRSRIESGAYGEGMLIPGEKELAAAFGVSRITAKRALDDLAAEGLVERMRGRGTKVTRRVGEHPVEASIDGLLVNLAEIGRDTRVALLEHDIGAALPDVASRLALASGERVRRAVRLRLIDDLPLSLSTTFVPAWVRCAWSARELAASPLIELLERAGVLVGSAEQSVTATAADAVAARHLEVAVGAPLLLIDRLVLDREARPVQLIRILYRPDRFRFKMSLTREQTAGQGAFSRPSRAPRAARGNREDKPETPG